MFESNEEKQAEKILFEILPPRVKQIFASAVFCGIKQAESIWREHPELPKNSRYNAGCQLRFIISYLLTKIADNELAARLTYTESSGNSSPIFLWDSRIKIQIKKHDKPEELPLISSNRSTNAKLNDSSLFAPDDFTECYALVTYHHKNFQCKYIQIGIPDAEYKRLLKWERIENYIDTELVENIEKNYSTEIKAAFDEKITKQFGLAVNK